MSYPSWTKRLSLLNLLLTLVLMGLLFRPSACAQADPVQSWLDRPGGEDTKEKP